MAENQRHTVLLCPGRYVQCARADEMHMDAAGVQVSRGPDPGSNLLSFSGHPGREP